MGMDAKNVWFIFYLFVALEFILVWSFFLHNYYANNPNWFNAIISPTSESVWEHTKLIIYPFLLVFLISLIFFRGRCNKSLAIFASTIVGIITMIIFHYMLELTYKPDDFTGMIVGHVINLFLALVIGLAFMYTFLTGKDRGRTPNMIALVLYLLLIALTVIWSFYKPCDCWIWKEPGIFAGL
jgi:hypothetical protein